MVFNHTPPLHVQEIVRQVGRQCKARYSAGMAGDPVTLIVVAPPKVPPAILIGHGDLRPGDQAAGATAADRRPGPASWLLDSQPADRSAKEPAERGSMVRAAS